MKTKTIITILLTTLFTVAQAQQYGVFEEANILCRDQKDSSFSFEVQVGEKIEDAETKYSWERVHHAQGTTVSGPRLVGYDYETQLTTSPLSTRVIVGMNAELETPFGETIKIQSIDYTARPEVFPVGIFATVTKENNPQYKGQYTCEINYESLF